VGHNPYIKFISNRYDFGFRFGFFRNPIHASDTQVLTTYQKLQRYTRRKDRIMTLVYAYYLGELLETNFNTAHQSYLNSHLSKYYFLASCYTYHLFEKSGIEQIYRTHTITLSLIYRMPRSDFLALIQD